MALACPQRSMKTRQICQDFLITATGRPYYGPGLPTAKHERILDLSTLSYKNIYLTRADPSHWIVHSQTKI